MKQTNQILNSKKNKKKERSNTERERERTAKCEGEQDLTFPANEFQQEKKKKTR